MVPGQMDFTIDSQSGVENFSWDDEVAKLGAGVEALDESIRIVTYPIPHGSGTLEERLSDEVLDKDFLMCILDALPNPGGEWVSRPPSTSLKWNNPVSKIHANLDYAHYRFRLKGTVPGRQYMLRWKEMIRNDHGFTTRPRELLVQANGVETVSQILALSPEYFDMELSIVEAEANLVMVPHDPRGQIVQPKPPCRSGGCGPESQDAGSSTASIFDGAEFKISLGRAQFGKSAGYLALNVGPRDPEGQSWVLHDPFDLISSDVTLQKRWVSNVNPGPPNLQGPNDSNVYVVEAPQVHAKVILPLDASDGVGTAPLGVAIVELRHANDPEGDWFKRYTLDFGPAQFVRLQSLDVTITERDADSARILKMMSSSYFSAEILELRHFAALPVGEEDVLRLDNLRTEQVMAWTATLPDGNFLRRWEYLLGESSHPMEQVLARWYWASSPGSDMAHQLFSEEFGTEEQVDYQVDTLHYPGLSPDGWMGHAVQRVSDSDGGWVESGYTGAYLLSLTEPVTSAAPLEGGDLEETRFEYPNLFNSWYAQLGDEADYFPYSPREIQVWRNNQLTARSVIIRSRAMTREIVYLNPDDGDLPAASMETVYRRDPATGRLTAIEHPDGTLTLFEEEVDPTGHWKTFRKRHGEPNGGKSAVLKGVEESLKVNIYGYPTNHTVKEIGGGSLTLSQVWHTQPDAFGRPTRVDYPDGSHELYSYACCGLESFRERNGNTVVLNRDLLGRISGYVSDGHEVLLERDLQERVVGVVRRAGAVVEPLLSRTFDAAGRLLEEMNALGGTRTFTRAYDSATGRTTHTVTDSATGGVAHYRTHRSGRLDETWGSALRPRRWEYGVEAHEGAQRATEKEIWLKPGPEAEAEWVKTLVDGAGRLMAVVKPSATGGDPVVVERFSYSGSGGVSLLAKHEDADGVATRFGYDTEGRLSKIMRTVGAEDAGYAGDDEFTLAQRSYGTHSGWGKPAAVTQVFRWNQAQQDLGTLMFRQQVSADGLNVEWTRMNGATPVTTTRIRTAPAPDGSQTETTVLPDGSRRVAQLALGRVVSLKSQTSAGATLTEETFAYDAFGRLASSTDKRSGTTLYGWNRADQLVSALRPPADGDGLERELEQYERLANGWLSAVVRPDGSRVEYGHDPNGDLRTVGGDGVEPVEYGYDTQGRLATLKLWRDHPGGAPSVTQWLRHPARGWVVAKRDALGLGRDWSYTEAGRLAEETTANGVVKTHEYRAGRLSAVGYSVDVPKRVEYTHGRSGLLERVVRVDRVGGVDVSSRTDLSRNGLDQPTGEANSGGALSGLGVGMGYDAFGRLTSAGFPGHESRYQYDTGGRVWKVGDGSQWAEQIYQPNSWLVGEVKHRAAGGALTLHTRRAFDYLGRATRVENRPGSLEAGTFDREYQFDLGGRRVEEGFPDGSRWRYGYDSQGRLASGRKEWADSGPVAGQQFEYGHDDAGNRTLRRWGGNASGQGLRESVETVNGANQVVSRTNPGSFDVMGLAPATAQVLVNGLASGVSRKGQYYHREVAVSNGAGAVSAAVSVVASAGAQTVGTVNGRQFVAKGVEALEYDAEGNLTRDGRWVYAWDGENRLVGMESVADGPVESRLRLKFEQDWAGRRVRKRVYAWTGGAGGGYGASPVVDVKYVWVGWHLAAGLGGANNAVLRSYLWGPDAGGGLAGDLDGAGGVGGLVGVKEGGTLRWAALDGQGNVAGLVGAGDGVAVGWYEYGPHGELLRATGSAGETNPVRYECKLEDRETGLVYYGFRYYHPGLGRWLGKDPMGEAGGLNLYGYVGGDPINGIDPYGLWDFRDALDGFTAWGSRKRDACKDWVNSGAGGLASQLGATAVNTVFDLTLGTLIDTPGALAHFGEGAGTFSGDPSLKNLPGLLSDVLIAAGAASGTGALASKAGQVLSKTAACKVGEKAVEQACSTQAKAAAAGVGEAVVTTPTVDRVRTVAQRSYDFAVQHPRIPGLSRPLLGKDAEVQATRWMRRWAERNDINRGPGGLQFQVRGANSVPDVVFEPARQIFDFKLTPRAVRSAQTQNFATDFPGFQIEYIFGP